MFLSRFLCFYCLLVLTTFGDSSPKFEQLDWVEFRQQQYVELADLEKPLGPPEEYQGNPIDWFLEKWYQKNDIELPEKCEDYLFVRRTYLNIIGLPPKVGDVQGFIEDSSEDKHIKLIDYLLNSRQDYAEHWITFWNDLLRNDEQTNIDGLREPITRWLYASLLSNKPYDIMVMELLNPKPDGPAGFLKGVNWRGRINASQRPVIQAAQTVGQVMLASPLKCASCHNHFLKPWKLMDTYGLAACFSEEGDLEVFRCDKPTGEVAQAKFPFEGLGTIDPEADVYTRRAQAAQMVVSPKNPRFAKTIVNRLWHKIMGRGLFEPVDDLDLGAIYPELMDWLAYDFMKNGYDLKHTLRLILTTEAYQRATKPDPYETQMKPEYAAPAIQRMQSEQFIDSIYQITHSEPEYEKVMDVLVDNDFVRAWRNRKPSVLATALGRPNREQVTTVRNHEATVLQMLEMVNGNEFASLMKNAVEQLLEKNPNLKENPSELIRIIYLRSFSRLASEEESEFLSSFIKGSGKKKVNPSAVEDMLWMVFMSPEFQYIH